MITECNSGVRHQLSYLGRWASCLRIRERKDAGIPEDLVCCEGCNIQPQVIIHCYPCRTIQTNPTPSPRNHSEPSPMMA